jgi:hypothetical protein
MVSGEEAAPGVPTDSAVFDGSVVLVRLIELVVFIV